MVTEHLPSPATILADWREAERELAKADPGSPEYDALAARVHDLARAYQASSREEILGPASPSGLAVTTFARSEIGVPSGR